jgi:hypothetical protein
MAALSRCWYIQRIAVAQVTDVQKFLPVTGGHLLQILDVDEPIPSGLIDGRQNLQCPYRRPDTSHWPFFILTDTTAAHAAVRITSDLVEPRRDLMLGEFAGQPPGLPWPVSASYQVSHKLFDELTALHPKPGQSFPLVITVRLATWFGRHDHFVLRLPVCALDADAPAVMVGFVGSHWKRSGRYPVSFLRQES